MLVESFLLMHTLLYVLSRKVNLWKKKGRKICVSLALLHLWTLPTLL